MIGRSLDSILIMPLIGVDLKKIGGGLNLRLRMALLVLLLLMMTTDVVIVVAVVVVDGRCGGS